jgi:2-polyprenyl-3-methyl-5-hydroxy-6-metoxy-1,4-benzoquinol methylase
MTLHSLRIATLEENPKKFEAIIADQHRQYDTNEHIKSLLDAIFLEEDREIAFSRFFNSNEFKTIVKILSLFGTTPDKTVCEIGGGPGFLTWALCKMGYQNISLFEPNDQYNTGTGYLRTRQDANDIRIFTTMPEWHTQNPQLYDAIITKNCIHHFTNMSQMAALIRQKMQPHGYWFAFREWFADSHTELYQLLADHPYCQPFDLYEWPYPAHHYVDAIEMAGFKLCTVIPYDYANNCLGTYSEAIGNKKNQAWTTEIDKLLNKKPETTVKKFWAETIKNKHHRGENRIYTRPQMFLFKKI